MQPKEDVLSSFISSISFTFLSTFNVKKSSYFSHAILSFQLLPAALPFSNCLLKASLSQLALIGDLAHSVGFDQLLRARWVPNWLLGRHYANMSRSDVH